VGAVRGSRASAVGAGVAAALAILVRPNLVPLAIVIAAWMIWRRSRALWFFLPAAIGAAGIALLNHRLYGSVAQSGYQPLQEMFEPANILPNLRLYGGWLFQKEAILTMLGAAALAAPAARLWPSASQRAARWLFVGVAATVLGIYLPYGQFDAWWYLRFLLPAWPMLAIGAATLAAALAKISRRRSVGLIAATILINLSLLAREHPASIGPGESIYATVGRSIRGLTAADAIVFTEQHSGTVRYYGGRMTLRWKRLDSDWLDNAAAWLQARGHHPYLLIERDELPYLREKYAESNQIGRLDWSPVLTFRHGALALYDLADRRFPGPEIDVADPRVPNQCWTPAPAPRFRRR
jgi:hypothetical protein